MQGTNMAKENSWYIWQHTISKAKVSFIPQKIEHPKVGFDWKSGYFDVWYMNII